MKFSAPKEEQAGQRACNSCHRRQMPAPAAPLIEKDDHKQRRHDKIDSRRIKGQNASRHCPKQGAQNPVHVI